MYQQQKLANVERRTWDKAKYEALAKEKVASGEAAAAEGDTYAKQERVKVRRRRRPRRLVSSQLTF